MSNPSHGYLADGAPLAIAHRGSSALHPENTMAAFDHAVALGYRHLETDVQATRDGTLVVFHDDRLERLTGRNGPVAAHDWAQLQGAKVHGRESIPLLEDLLAAWPDVMVNIDPKNDWSVEPLVQALRRTGAVARVCIGGFSAPRLHRLREAFGPALCTSMAPGEVVRLRLSSYGVPAGRFAAACVQVPERHRGLRVVDRRLLRAARALGIKVHVWTVNARRDMERLLDMQVDGLISDETDVLKQVFQARGLWR